MNKFLTLNLSSDLVKAINEQLELSRFWIVQDRNNIPLMIFDFKTQDLWHMKLDTTSERHFLGWEIIRPPSLNILELDLKNLNLANLKWEAPTFDNLYEFSSAFELKYKENEGESKNNAVHKVLHLLSSFNEIATIEHLKLDSYLGKTNSLCLMAHCNFFCNKSKQCFYAFCLKNEFHLISPMGDEKTRKVINIKESIKLINIETLTYADYKAVRLPKLDPSQFTDPNKGIWELFGMPQADLETLGARARNPVLDIKDHNVAIDFGTSSTVVAIDIHGRYELLRVGLDDLRATPKPEHFENPTVLEFINVHQLLEAWRNSAYRPSILWDDVRGSHEAKTNFQYNATDSKIVSSVLSKLKQWALRDINDQRSLITDQTNQTEYSFSPIQKNFPTKGVPLTIPENADLDPIELYAWMLGMMINWRGRGLFLNYYMTFPVDYPRDIKDKILASFSRGLQRSFPEPLVRSPEFAYFNVEEVGTEPAAYAAIALQTLNIPCTVEGSAYAVFDFGGGTSDFDFGLYRLPTNQEADNGYEKTIEHFKSSGDKFLGGENILENLAYLVFKKNLDVCVKQNITFTVPINEQPFAGSELLVTNTQIASTNTTMLIGQLREFWEKGSFNVAGEKSKINGGILKIALLDRNGDKKNCELVIDTEQLEGFLYFTILEGVKSFYVSLKEAFQGKMQETVHILLAGNSFKSKWISELFLNEEIEKKNNEGELNAETVNKRANDLKDYISNLFKEQLPEFIIHKPLLGVPTDPYAPTGKTGVALGILKICPGTEILVKNLSIDSANGEAPFALFVGAIKQGIFQPALAQGVSYNKWFETGIIRGRVFILVYSTSPKSLNGELTAGSPGIITKKIMVSAESEGHRVFIKAVAPSSITLCTVPKDQHPDTHDTHNLQPIDL